jgi:hypothetical protein
MGHLSGASGLSFGPAAGTNTSFRATTTATPFVAEQSGATLTLAGLSAAVGPLRMTAAIASQRLAGAAGQLNAVQPPDR